MAYQAATADAEPSVDEFDFDWAAAEAELSSVGYDGIPYVPRRWLWAGYIPVGSPVIFAASGETGKGLLLCAVAARVVLGLPFPDEDQAIRRAPKRVVWITGAGEDDPWEDMAPRLRAAIMVAVAEFGLDPELAGEQGAIRLVRDLSRWRGGDRVSLPADCPRIAGELKAINRKAGPDVGLVVADSLSALLSDGYTIDSRQGARRVNGMLADFARAAKVALVIIHHLTKDKKVAGSPAVLDSLRLAFTIERSKDDPDVRTITRHKANISSAAPQQYAVRGDGPTTHAEFVNADDERGARAGAALPDERYATAAETATPAGPWRVLRLTQFAAGGEARDVLSGDAANGDIARSMAGHDAGAELAWTPDARKPHMALATFKRGDGSVARYAVFPA